MAVRLNTSHIVPRWSGMQQHGRRQMTADAESMRMPRWQLLQHTWLDPSSPLSTCRFTTYRLAPSESWVGPEYLYKSRHSLNGCKQYI